MTTPFDDFRALVLGLPPLPRVSLSATPGVDAAESFGGSLDVGGIASWLVSARGEAGTVVTRPMIAVFAASQGVAAHGVDVETPASVSGLVAAASAGQGDLARACTANDLGLKVLDLAVSLPGGDMTREASLDARACAATIAFGMEAAAGGHTLLCLTGKAAGGETAARALLATLDVAGSGLDMAEPEHVRLRADKAIAAALALHQPNLADPLEALRRLGGREIAAIAGAIVAARIESAPVILSGPAALAAAAVLYRLSPASIEHCVLARGQGGALPLGGILGEDGRPDAALDCVRAATIARLCAEAFSGAGVRL